MTDMAGRDANQAVAFPELSVCSPELASQQASGLAASGSWVARTRCRKDVRLAVTRPVGTGGSSLGVERKWCELQENINPDNALGQGIQRWTSPRRDTAFLHL